MKLFLYIALLLFSVPGIAGSFHEPILQSPNGNPDWLVVRPGVHVSAAELVQRYSSELGLTDADQLVLYRTDHDQIGFAHYRYQQYYHGIKVDGAELLVHEQNGQVRSLNGKLARGLHADIRTSLEADEALARALTQVPAQRYMWQSGRAEAMLRRITRNPNATYYPKPELTLVAPGFTGDPNDYRIAWVMEIFAQQPMSRQTVYVDARSGAILESLNMVCEQNAPGTAVTKYSGTRQIVTDSLPSSTGFRLVETTRGNGIETYNMQRGTNHDNAVDFTDDDNNWDTFNATQDEVARDVHWGAEMTYDYYLQKHHHAGIDGQNMGLIGYVHYDIAWSNASWTGHWAQFGDGGGDWSPLTSLDVVGHEFTHGVTGFSAKLRYRNESGALNESFSDIFGAAIEFWADPDHADWLVGEDFNHNGGALRNMKNPKAEQNPDTYLGENWIFGSSDNGGVHTNSGVQNHWFYLLTDGDSGTNDKGDTFAVHGVGLDTAAAIAYRNLTYYLVELSNYADAREGTLRAAEDLYGICSAPYKETVNAWYAVGVGEKLSAFDLKATQILEPAPLTCGLASAANVAMQFRYTGCDADLMPGDKIPMAYQINDNPPVWDTLVVNSPITAGDTVNYTFSAPADALLTPGHYQLRCWTGYGPDENPVNNAATRTIESIPNHDIDLRLQQVERPATGCFLGTQAPQIQLGFWGCDTLAADEALVLSYSVNGAPPVSETMTVPKTLHTGDALKYTFAAPADFSAYGPYTINAWVQYGADTVTTNDSLLNLQIFQPAPIVRDNVITFEAADNSLDSLYLQYGSEVQILSSPDAARSGKSGLRITGGDMAQALADGKAQVPDADNVWTANTGFRSKLCVCADLSGLATATLKFDAKQTFSSYYLKNFGAHAPYASSLRVLANGKAVSQTYKPTTPNFDPWKSRQIDLTDYVGQSVEVCIQMHTGLSPELDSAGVGDKILLDNVSIVGDLASGTASPNAAGPDWTVMPNPGNGLFFVEFQSSRQQPVTLHVVDALGRTAHTLHANAGAGKNRLPLDLKGMPAGMYVVQLYLEAGQFSQRLMLQRG